nr:putative ribonuclease H-like domain-containing protein [Tanacetum cinerariifolium]
SFSPGQTYNTSEPVTTSQPNPQTLTNFQNQQFQQYHTATLSSNNAKFPYLKKDKYETWAMKMKYWIMNTDHNLWKIIQNRNSKKSLGRDSKGWIIILPPVSWSQVALTLKTRVGLEYLSFDDLYNKLRSLEINVKGGSSYGSRSTTVAPTHSAFIGAASTNTKIVYSDQPSYSSSISYTPTPSGRSTGDGRIRHQMADGYAFIKDQQVLKKADRKINFNNKDSARFDRRKARCYNCLRLGHFARECNVKKVDEKSRYSAFKILEVKSEEPKAMVSVDSMLNWNEHDAENKTEEAEQVYGLMAGFESDFAVHAGNAVGGVNPVAAEFAMMGISLKAKIKKQEWEIKFVESLARFNKCKSHLIKDCHVYDTVDNFPSVASAAATVPAGSRISSASTSAGRSIPAANKNRSASIYAGSRNRSASIHADRSIPTASRNRPASIHAGTCIPAGRINKPTPFPAGSSVPTGWTNPAARPFFRPTNLLKEVQLHLEVEMNKVLFTDDECLVPTKEFQLPDESQVVLRIPRRHDLYTFNLSDIHPEQQINCLLAKASLEESTKWHRRMTHVNFKTINKLAKQGLVEGLPLKLFTNEHNYVACNKGKQHKASYKAIFVVR